MTGDEPTYFTTADEWRGWLTENHEREPELWLGFWKVHTGRPTIGNAAAVDEALCFGWIDGRMSGVDADRWRKRFTPRRPGSIWSNVNLARFAELDAAGLVAPAGYAAFERRSAHRQGVYTYENDEVDFSPEYAAVLAASPEAAAFLAAQRPSYRRVVQRWVMSAKRGETRDRRMTELVTDSAAGRLIRSQRYGRPAAGGPETGGPEQPAPGTR